MALEQYLGFLKTPPLWEHKACAIKQFLFPKIDLQDFVPQAFNPKLRLGHQMEHVFKQLIEHSSQFEIIVYNLPIRNEERTLGEIDFILREKSSKKLIHVELTYKFYIINPEIPAPLHQLIGPNKKDSFFSKLEKIKDQQFTLLHTSEGIKALEERSINHAEILHQTCFKGQLFIPYQADKTTIKPLNTDCIVGSWLRFDAFDTIKFKSFEYYIPVKSEWVIAPHENVHWSSHFDVLAEIKLRMLKENAPMIWMRRSETEFEKFFIVWW